LLILFINIQKN